MADELVDWADLKALGILAGERADAAIDSAPVRWVLELCDDHAGMERRHDRIAQVLREAYVSGFCCGADSMLFHLRKKGQR